QPDLAGWDSTRVAERPRGTRVRIMPQWVCEILSPSTADRDRGPKRETYHARHIAHYWLVDLEAERLTVLAWTEDGYQTELVAHPGDAIAAAPFAEIPLDLARIWNG
ncbi:MAG: Uma2 family endonuclease, partial [Myxococcota bacterium]